MNQDPFEYLSSLQAMGIRLDLSVFGRLLERMGDPQNAYPSILVAGTNGKGSVCAMASTILTSAGYRVGLYTSPHLTDVRERVRTDGHLISETDMADCIRCVRQYVSEPLTYFEFLTAVAFLHFFRKKVDIAVLEVGMGGRLDATNVVHPLVCAISNISVEHSAYLGTRLGQIAAEKAGVIKKGGICISAATQRPVVDVLEDTCRKHRAQLYRIGRDFQVRTDRKASTFSCRGLDGNYRRLSCPLLGRHQSRNAAVAVAIMEVLARKGWAIHEEAIRKGLDTTQWEGRLEIVGNHPQILLDGAHNPAGVTALCTSLKEHFTYKRLIMICGILRDKNFRVMIRDLAQMADTLILTRPDNERALMPAEMAEVAKQACSGDVLIQNDPAEALHTALAAADPEDLICAAGSLYLVGRLKEILRPANRR